MNMRGRFGRTRHDQRAETGQQIFAFSEYRHRVVVAAEQDQPHLGVVQALDQLVVQLAGVRRRRARVENVTCDEHGIDGLGDHGIEQPVDQGLMLGLACLAHEMLTEMPVGGVKEAHGGRRDFARMRCRVRPRF